MRFRIASLVTGGFLLGAALATPATAAGTVAAWGKNMEGQLGDGSTTDRSTPVSVLSSGALAGKAVTQIDGGGFHTCAATSDGRGYCWGNNSLGQLGDGTTELRTAPVAVDMSGALSGKTLTQISAGFEHTCALTSEGRVFCWGDNFYGQLGDGSTTDRSAPTAVLMSGVLAGKTVTQISAGDFHTCAVTSEGGAYCWGDNYYGQLGDNTTTNRSSPVAIVDANNALAGKTLTQISAGYLHTCALTSDGSAHCWGRNSSGQLGDDTTTDRSEPAAVVASGALAGRTVIQISTGDGHTCAVTSDGGAYCWGFNGNGTFPLACGPYPPAMAYYCYGGSGQLGDGSSTNRRTPTAVLTNGALAGKAMAQISAGSSHTCAVTADGRAYCWGYNGDDDIGDRGRRLGDGGTLSSVAPVSVDASGVLAGKFLWQVDAAGHHSAAVAPACGPGIDITSGAKAQWHAFALPLTATARPLTPAGVLGTGTPTNLTTAQYNIANPAAGTGWVIFRRDR